MTPEWRKSSRSTNQGGECVEVAALPEGIAIRDSKNPGAGHLILEQAHFAQLIQLVKADEHR